ncbi:hypothetical protein Tco_0804373 [Tanacetum coccineum]|uniref:Uncharacterized protein n=1 Tax=Tanacetum coccineum TaxID=301880 RepID=A0ABQ5A8E4_9ASTR
MLQAVDVYPDEEIDKQKLEAHSSYMAKIQRSHLTNQVLLIRHWNRYKSMMKMKLFANVRRHSEQLKSINDTYVLEKDDSKIPYEYSDPANRFCPDGEETVTLEKESRSKLDKDVVKPYNYTYQNSLYETFKPPSKTYLDQLERAKEVRKTMWRKTFVRTKPNIAKKPGLSYPVSKSIRKVDISYNKDNNFNHFRTCVNKLWSNHTYSAFPNPTAKTMEVLIKTLLMPLSDKTILDSHCLS